MAVCPPEELQVSFCVWVRRRHLHAHGMHPAAIYLHGLSNCSWPKADLYKVLKADIYE